MRGALGGPSHGDEISATAKSQIIPKPSRPLQRLNPMGSRITTSAPTLLLLTLLATLVAPSNAEACGCAGRVSSPVSVKAASVVFVGTAETVTGGMPRPRIATFKVARMYRGTAQDRIVITGDGTTCDVDFEEGLAYVVYANQERGAYYTHKCTRTRLLAIGAEDVRYLEMLEAGEPRAVLHGDVLRNTMARGKPALQAPFEPLDVVARRNGRRRSVATDAWGPYQLVLAPGEYEVWVERAGRRVSAVHKVTLRPDDDRRLMIPSDFPCEVCDKMLRNRR